MAKRGTGTTRANSGTTTANPPGAATAETIEQRVMAYAEQLGRFAGTLRVQAEGWLDRETLNKQIASVRDGASNLLEHLARGMNEASSRTPAAAAAGGGTGGRSGGVVDAPGKKHRKPAPANPGANARKSQAAKMRAAMPMAKTSRRRGRG